MAFPEVPVPLQRPRRLRRTPALRRMVQETQVLPGDLIYPLFCVPGEGVCEPVGSMPGVQRFSADRLADEVKEIADLGIAGVILFGVPESKDAQGSQAYAEQGIAQRAVAAVKAASPDLVAVADVCLCEYTDHGHCGVLREGEVQNDETLPLLARASVSLARAGADVIAPSDMMDGRVAAIRSALDASGFASTAILSYAAKYASAFYGPFREAAESTPSEGDRRGYQMDPPNLREAIREIELDLVEGADMIMVKPALPYLDVIRVARDHFDAPLAAYQVSGEYSMMRAAIERGWLEERRAIEESLVSIRRAGADLILSYFAKDYARALRSPAG